MPGRGCLTCASSPNPYYVEELRFHTGTEQAVQDYVMQGEYREEFLKKLNDLLEFVIPKYEQEGRNAARDRDRMFYRRTPSFGDDRREVFKRLTESGRYEIQLEHTGTRGRMEESKYVFFFQDQGEELSRHMSPARHCQIRRNCGDFKPCGRIQISRDDHYSIKDPHGKCDSCQKVL